MRIFGLSALAFLFACTDGSSDEETKNDDTETSTTTGDDEDEDGFPSDVDCDDNDRDINPEADEECDGVDNNCDGDVDEGVGATWYFDSDGDRFGDPDSSETACEAPEDYVADNTDCDDRDRGVNPDARDVCDGVDNNCDDAIDEDATLSDWYPDDDGDGFGDASARPESGCDAPAGYVEDSSDCDDGDRGINPDANDVCNGEDDNCDGDIDEDARFSDWYTDDDGDGYGDPDSGVSACDAPANTVEDDNDCDDRDDEIYPGADEICDGLDQDCDGRIDDNPVDGDVWYADRDGDAYGDASNTEISCDQPAGYIVNSSDCNDTDASAHPGAAEVCNGADDDCDGSVDESATDTLTWYRDADSDGFGGTTSTTSCTAPAGYVTTSSDCDDARATVYPGAAETCNNLDDDCDGSIDENATDATLWFIDTDGDTYGDPATNQLECDQPSGYVSNSSDCDDDDRTIKPTASELCDGVDNDCDGTADQGAADADTWYADSDNDGYGNPSVLTTACNQPAGYIADDSDCNDGSASAFPGATEVCDLRDNDCNGLVDDDATDLAYLAEDDDGDGFGAPGTTDYRCGGAENEYDCDDTDAAEPVVVDAINGSAVGTGSLSDPLVSIQDGIDTANECVIVYPGTYAELIDFGGRDLVVSSTSGAGSTVIDATGRGGPAVTFDSGESSAAELIGFTLTGGDGDLDETSSSSSCSSSATCTTYYQTYCGGGVYVSASSPTLRDLVILSNTLPTAATTASGDDTYIVSSFGGGLCLMDASVTASGLSVLSNYADQGGGIYLDGTSSLTLTQSKLLGNSATDGGALNALGTVSLSNTVSAFNSVDGDGASLLAQDGTITATNTVFAGDTGSALYVAGTSGVTVRNSIIYNATDYGLEVDSTASWSGTYNDVYGNTVGNYSGVADTTGSNGNLSVNPLFVSYTDDGDFSDDNFKLAESSTLFNVGNPSATYNDSDGSRNDIGAYGGPGNDW